jgi:uncharacterized protein
MYKILFFLAITLLTSKVMSQQNNNEIVAEGSSKIKVKPDIAKFTFIIEKRDTSEKKAINKLNIAISEVEKILNKVGFANNSIKVSDLDISTSQNDDNKRKTYIVNNVLKFEFYLDNKLIDAIYSQIQTSGIQDLEIEYDTKLSDSLEKNTRIKLLQSAIEDAKTNALTIAKTLGIKLGQVKQVRKSALGYSVDKVEIAKFTPPKIARDTEIRYNTSFDKFEIEEVEIEEQITIIYAIENLKE